MLHNKKTDKKASVLTEQKGKNTPLAPQQSHCEEKKDKLKEGRSSPLITLAVSLKKPGVIKERKLLPNVVTSVGTAAGSQGTTLHAPVATLQPGVQTSANKGVHLQQSSGASNVLQILNTSQDGRRTPTHSNLVTVLPPTPPNEPVAVQPVSQTVSRVVHKGLPGQLPMQRVQVFVKQVAAQPSKPPGVGVSPFSSPSFRIMKTSQILTPPIDKRVAPVSSPAKPEQPCGKTEQPLLKTDQRPEKPEQPPQKPGESLQKPEEPQGCRPSEISSEMPATKDLSSTLTSLEDSSEATTKPSVAVATNDGVRVGGDEEVIDVGETLITSQDETDSQVEVAESEVEIREDTKEGENLSRENLKLMVCVRCCILKRDFTFNGTVKPALVATCLQNPLLLCFP